MLRRQVHIRRVRRIRLSLDNIADKMFRGIFSRFNRDIVENSPAKLFRM